MPRMKRYPDRRTYARVHAQRRRDEKLAETNRSSTTCQRGQGAGRCGAMLETVVLAGGATRTVCPLCERRRRGICRDCPRPVVGRVGSALRCAMHKEAAKRDQERLSAMRNKPEQTRRDKRARDEQRRTRCPSYLAKLEYKRAWRKANREKIRAQKRRSYERHRETIGVYMAEYRARHRAHYRDLMNQKVRVRQALWTPPICTAEGCGAIIEHDWVPRAKSVVRRRPARCDAHCWPHELRKRNAARAALIEYARAEMNAGVASRSRVARRPPGYFETRAAGGLRKCLTPRCQTVLTGRKKKCERCKVADARRAAAVLTQHRGRGRRVDLERSA